MSEVPSSAGLPATLPPAEIDFQNRWADLENRAAAVEEARVKLEEERDQLRQKQDEVQRTASSELGAGVGELQKQLETTKEEYHQLLQERKVEQERLARLEGEAAKRAEELTKLGTERLHHLYERNMAQAKLEPVQEALERSEHERTSAERVVEELHARLADAENQCNQHLREKSALQRDFALQVEVLKADVALHKSVAEDSQKAEKAARREVQKAQEQLRDRTKSLASERASLEGQLAHRKEELAREREQREEARRLLTEAQQDRDEEAKGGAAKAKYVEDLTSQVTSLTASLARLEQEHEALLQERLPGDLPEGISSVSQLVQNLLTAQEEACRERQAKEQVQELLKEVEREVRLRFQALASRADEAVRLHDMAAELAQENEDFRERLERLGAAKQALEKKVQRAEYSAQIMEGHMSALARQLAVLVHENRKLGGKAGFPGGQEVDIASLEADRRCFRNTEELTRQNVSLRLAVARCMQTQGKELPVEELQEQTAELCSASRGQSSPDAEDQQEAQVSRPHKVRRAQKALMQSVLDEQAAHAAPAKEPDAEILAELAAAQREFASNLESRKAAEEKLRSEALQLRRRLSELERQLENETKAKAALQDQLQTAQVASQPQPTLRETTLPELGAAQVPSREGQALEQALREKGQLAAQADLLRQRAAALEKSNAQLTAERATQLQVRQDLETDLAARREETRTLQQKLTATSQQQTLQERWEESARERERRLEANVQELRAEAANLRCDLRACRQERSVAPPAGLENDDQVQILWERVQRMESHSSALADEVTMYQQRLLAISEARAKEESDSDILLQLVDQLRQAGEVGAARRQELEVRLSGREQEAAVLRAESATLRRRLDAEREAIHGLREQFRRQEREAVNIMQLEHVMTENQQRSARIVELEGREAQLLKDLSAAQENSAPLQARVDSLLKDADAAARTQKELEAKVDEWKRLHDEVVQKLDHHDVNELKRLREEAPRWQTQRTDLNARIERLQDELRQRQEELKLRTQELQGAKALKEKNEELQRSVVERTSRIEQLTKAKAQLQESISKKDSHCKQVENLKALRDKKIEELQRDLKKSQEESQRQLSQGTQKSQEEVKQAQLKADRALALAMDCHRALEAGVSARAASAASAPSSTAGPTRAAAAAAARGVNAEEASVRANKRQRSGAEESVETLRTTTSADHFPVGVDPQRADTLQLERSSSEAKAAVERTDVSAAADHAGSSNSAAATTGAAAAPSLQVHAASNASDPSGGLKRRASSGAGDAPGPAGTGASVSSTNSVVETAPAMQTGARVMTAVKAGALAMQSASPGTASFAGATATAAGRVTASAAQVRGVVGMVVDVDDVDQPNTGST